MNNLQTMETNKLLHAMASIFEYYIGMHGEVADKTLQRLNKDLALMEAEVLKRNIDPEMPLIKEIQNLVKRSEGIEKLKLNNE